MIRSKVLLKILVQFFSIQTQIGNIIYFGVLFGYRPFNSTKKEGVEKLINLKCSILIYVIFRLSKDYDYEYYNIM